jgi:branched-chain amino acid transport system permease protein
MVVLGGAGTLLGPVLGAAVIVLVKTLLSMYVARWPTVMGLIFILVVLFARGGIMGGFRRGWAWLQARRAARLGAAVLAPATNEGRHEEVPRTSG